MQLNKTSGSVDISNTAKASSKISAKVETSPSAQNAASQKVSSQALKTSPLPVLPRSVSSLISSCGLPADKLSASILSFAKFFSLPLKPELMQDIRRQAFVPSSAQSDAVKQALAPAADDSGSSLTAKTREAFSLAAAAAESKGVELSPKGLEAYAEAVDPEWQRRQNDGERQRRRQNKNKEQADEKAPKHTLPITAAALEKMALDSVCNDQLLAILNKLPCKDGRRWIVLPFDFCENGREFKVSMRILLDGAKENSRASCLALDIAESSIAESVASESASAESVVAENKTVADATSVPARHETEKRWLFVLETDSDSADRLAVHVKPELSKDNCRTIVRELSALLEIKPERISVNRSAENFPCEAGLGEDLLRSIDEAV